MQWRVVLQMDCCLLVYHNGLIRSAINITTFEAHVLRLGIWRSFCKQFLMLVLICRLSFHTRIKDWISKRIFSFCKKKNIWTKDQMKINWLKNGYFFLSLCWLFWVFDVVFILMCSLSTFEHCSTVGKRFQITWISFTCGILCFIETFY